MKLTRSHLLPNLITLLHLLCGLCSIILVWHQQYQTAAWLILFAGGLDYLDGYTARRLNATTRMGIWFDSCADAVSFGAAVSCMLYSKWLAQFGWMGLLWSIIYCICVFFRLLRFSIHHSSNPHKEYQGLPCPIAGCYFALILITLPSHFISEPFVHPLPLFVTFIPILFFPIMMVSTIILPRITLQNQKCQLNKG